MKYLFLLLLFCTSFLNAQSKHDYNWVMGSSNVLMGEDFGASVIDFNYDTLHIYKRNLLNADYNLATSVVTYSDNNGKLQFFTNGRYILDSTFTLMQNGDDLEVGLTGYDGNAGNQSIVAMQMPSDTSKIILVYSDTRVDTLPYPYSSGLFYSIIDMKLNNGKGKVIEKNIQAYSGIMFASPIGAVRHANGRDWWLTKLDNNNNKIYIFLLSTNGLHLYSEQILDCSPFEPGLGQTVFSENGEKYASIHHSGLLGEDYFFVIIANFDRCNATFDQAVNIKFVNIGALGGGIAFSPNSKYLYATSSNLLFQYDLNAIDIEKSIDTVAIFDGNIDPFPNDFYLMKLGPDGKIYVSCKNSSKYLTVINNPDKKGKACNVVQRQVKLKSYNQQTFQNHPNYRLGPLKGSPCDTVSVATKDIKPEDYGIKLFPNPSSTIIKIDITIPQYDPSIKTEVVVVDVSGAIVMRYVMPDFAYLATLDISKLPSGVYGVQLRQPQRSGAKVLATEKLVVVE